MTSITPLFAQHQQLQAKMMSFGGWNMPLHYGSQITEHHHVRQTAGMFDVSHMRVIDFIGKDAQRFLEFALSNDIKKLTVLGKALYSCLLNEQGGVIDDLIIYYLDENHYRTVVNAGTAKKDLAWFEALRAQTRYQLDIIAREHLGILAVQGPQAREKCWQALPEITPATQSLKPFFSCRVQTEKLGEIMVARTGYTGEDGFELIIENAHITTIWQLLFSQNVHPCGLGARDTLRLEAGLHLSGQDMDEQTLPTNIGLGWIVDLSSSRAFVGRNAIEQTAPTSKLVGLILQKEDEKISGVLRTQQQVVTPDGVGLISSGTFSPSIQESIALARVPITTQADQLVEVHMRQKILHAKVVNLPFVRDGKILVQNTTQNTGKV